MEADLRSVERLIASLRATRIDGPAAIASPHLPPAAAQPLVLAVDEATTAPQTNLAAWTVLSLGLSVLACGAVLLGLSVAQERDDLWSLGLPLAIGGQAALVVGLVLQLEGLWQNRQTARTLTALDDELSRVRRATTSAVR